MKVIIERLVAADGQRCDDVRSSWASLAQTALADASATSPPSVDAWVLTPHNVEMRPAYYSCPSCVCAVKMHETACPHCGARTKSEDGSIAKTAVAALLGLAGLAGCSGQATKYGVPATEEPRPEATTESTSTSDPASTTDPASSAAPATSSSP